LIPPPPLPTTGKFVASASPLIPPPPLPTTGKFVA
jgi:hypothetical protein